MRRFGFFFLFFFVIGLSLVLVSCSSDKKKERPLGKVQSEPYELLLVADKEWLNTSAGQALLVVLESPIQGLPQPESHFRLTKINPSALDGIFRFYGNILEVNIGRQYPEARLAMRRDVYCRPQTVLYLEAPDDESFVQLIRNQAESVLSLFDEREFTRERSYLSGTYSGTLMRQAQKQFGVSINAPKDLDDIKEGKDFFWASTSKEEFRLNICMYSLPMREVTESNFVAMRDSVMQINIPGGKEGQWMETDSRSVLFKQRMLPDKKTSVLEVRGLWDMRHDAMGGPFVSYVMKDSVKNRILVSEGFIFAPQKNKRAMIRELEAALQTITLNSVL